MILETKLHFLPPKSDNSGRVAAFEVMVNNTAIANLIRENKIEQMMSVMQTAHQEDMTTMEKSIENLTGIK
tara:strand:- start:447 stop:659 length:213 start_codon:yes stop_codon:yes gene_type:complete